MIRCACNDPYCKGAIWFDNPSSALWHRDKDGVETVMYLDPNNAVKLIAELRQYLIYLCNNGGGNE